MSEYTTIYLLCKEIPLLKYKEHPSYEECQKLSKEDLMEVIREVVTHHLPTLEVVAPHHKGSVLNSAFATELGGLIADSRIDAWIYGHSHTNIDVEINGTEVVCNQMGYVCQNEHITNGFNPGKCLVL